MSSFYQQPQHDFGSNLSLLSLSSSTAGSDTEMSIGLEKLNAEDSMNRFEAEYSYNQDGNSDRSRSRYVWTVCAAVSLLSSKYLLVDLDIHFPLHLHLVQLATTSILALIYLLLWRSEPSDEEPHRSSILGWVFLVGFTCLMAASMMLSLQATLHFQNVTTLVMLSVVSYLVKLLITDRSRFKWLQCLFLALSCAGILCGEYRIEVGGLLTSIPAALLAGLAGALYSVAVDHFHSVVSDSNRINILLCCSGLVMTTYWALRVEDTVAFQEAIEVKYLPMLALNAFSTALAILVGKSVLFPIDTITPRHSSESRHEFRVADAVTVLALSGVIGCATTLMRRRSYTTNLQVFAFFVALVCLAGHSLFQNIRDRSWNRDGHREYAFFSASSALESIDSENTMVSEESDTTQNSNIQGYRKWFFVRSLVVGLTVASLWVVFPVLNFQERLYVETTIETPHLDFEYMPTVAAELVISMYKEPLDHVSFLVSELRQMAGLSGARVHIYVKDSNANIEEIKQRTDADNVTVLPNIGREGETYLYHILNQWDSLAKHTVFLQADVHNPREFYPRVRDYYDPNRTGMLSLGWSGNVCNCDDCGDRWSFHDTTKLFHSIHSRIYNNSTACDQVMLSYKGQFIASASRIRGIDKAIYHDLREAFVDENSWAHQEEFLKGKEDSMSAPFFGYTMERMWNLVMQCSSTDVSWKCPTLLSGGRIGGSIEDCQCFDAVAGGDL